MPLNISNVFPLKMVDVHFSCATKILKANVISLNSFSSHASHAELLEYYSSIECEKIYLVHSQEDRKKEFKPLLEEEISKKNHTTKVVLPDSKTKMYL